MKKYCLVTILLSVLMSMPMFAYDFVQNGIYYNIEGDHVSVTYSGNGVYTGSVSIPSQVTYGGVTYPVTAIGEWAFEGGEGITYLYIPSSITSIGEYAFIDCGSNINVYISDIKAWCKVHFGNEHSSPLSSAKEFFLRYGVKTYKAVKSLYIPNGVESISNFAFYQCKSITSLSIAGSVKSIGSSAFEDCTGLTSIYLSEGIESIGGSSFEGCSDLSTIILPSTLSSIALNAFKNCGNLNTIVSRIQEPFTFLDNVFCTYSTATVIIPEGTTTAYQSTDGWNLFDNITDDSSQYSTKRIIHVETAGTLPNLISADEKYQIEELTLTGELNGTDILFIRDLSGIDYFIESYNDSEEPYDVINIMTPGNLKILDISNAMIVSGGDGYYAKLTSRYYTRIGTMNNSISDYMFSGCKLIFIELPLSVNSIGSSAFRNCSGLTSVTIPNSVESIGNYAFYNCNGLTSVTIPNSVNSIGNSAFEGCSGLTSVIIGNGVTTIGGSAFFGCSGLTSVTIPNSVTSIGYSAFVGCSGLTSVTIGNSVTSIGGNAFSRCSGLASIIVDGGNQKYDSRDNCNAILETSNNTLIAGCKNTIIPNSVTSIGDKAFYGCSSLTSIKIPNSVTSIGSSAFEGCSGLTSVTIPNSVTSISSSAFYRCSGLTSVTIPNSVTSIGSSAFYRCSGLTSVTIPNSVTSIGSNAFYNCSGLTSVTIPNSATSIGSSAFYGCSGLTSIVSLNSNPPSVTYSSTFTNVDKNNCIVWVPKGSLSAYKGANVWKDFANIFELVEGDLNLDEVVDQNDMDALVGFVMGKNPEGFYEGLADLNGDNKIDAADVVKMVDLVRASSGLGTVSQFVIENSVVSSLTCTLNNERSEAIQLTKCELYCNHNLVSYQSFSGASASVAAGGSKECTFNNLAKLNSSTGFTVCWYYTANGKNYVYRCPLKE